MKKKVLVVDDKSENLYLLELILKGSGYTTISAKNGEEALGSARNDIPDLIITDILMPVMDGFTLCREFKKDEMLCNVPFIFYTATYTDPKDEDFALSLGADRFLLKPQDPDEFITIIEDVLKETKKKSVKTPEISSTPENVVLHEYSEALVRKLEDKMFQAEQAEKEVRKYNIALLREIEEHKQTENLLRESEERFRILYNDARIGLYRTTPDGKVLMANKYLIEMLGFSSLEELTERNLNKSGLEFINQRKRFIEQIEKYGEVKDFESKWIGKDGKEIFIRESARLICNESGKKLYYDGMVEDISEKKQTEFALKKSERLFYTLANVSPVGIFKTNDSGETTYVNPKWCQISGLTQEEALENNWLNAVHPDDREKLISGWQEAVKLRKSSYSEYRFLHKDGAIINVMGQAVPEKNSENKIIGYIGTITDITGLKHAEEEIAMLANALKSINECVSITDMKDNIIFVNESFIKTYGYNETELIGKPMTLVRASNNTPEVVNNILPSTLLGGWSGELLNRRKDGSEFPIYLSTTIIPDKDNNPVALIGVAKDITGTKLNEQELIKAKEFAEHSNKMKDAFIANISHEIRTPLNGVLGMTSIIKEIYSQYIKENEAEYFTAIKESCERIVRTIDLILNYSQLETGTFVINPKAIELTAICDSIANQFDMRAKSKSLSLSFQNNLGPTFIFADEYSIFQVIFYLVENAIIYTKSGFVKVELYRNALDEVLLDVADSGIGISEEYLDYVFQPFRQEQMGYNREYEGLGLSLALVKKILDMHNVDISVKSKKWEGTIFTINFGKQAKTLEGKSTIINNNSKVDFNEAKLDKVVLVVEDDYVNQMTIKKFITKKYKALVTDSYDGVMEILRNNRVDLILMDISLKGKKNGLEITKEIKVLKEYNFIPIIAATAHSSERDRMETIEAGCDDYLSKPFSMNQLLNKIDKFLL